jgi:hypothetical protein
MLPGSEGAPGAMRSSSTEPSLGCGGLVGSPEEAFKLATRPVVPGSRVRGGRQEPDPAGFAAVSGMLEFGDAIEDGAVQRRQVFGARVRVHHG